MERKHRGVLGGKAACPTAGFTGAREETWARRHGGQRNPHGISCQPVDINNFGIVMSYAVIIYNDAYGIRVAFCHAGNHEGPYQQTCVYVL